MHIVHGELRKEPYIKSGVGQDGQSTLFIVELSEMTKDRQSGEKTYANYSAAIFAKSPAQIDYYTASTVKGNYIVLTSEKLKVDVSPCGKYIKLQMENARLEGAQYIQGAPAQQQEPQQSYQQAPQQMQQAPQQAPQQMMQAPQQRPQMQQAPSLAQQAAQHPQAQPMQQQPAQGFDNFDDDIPFNHPR